MQDIASGADAAQREHHKSVEQLGRWNKKSDELNRARLDQQYKDLQEAKALEQQLIDSKKKVLVALDKNRKAIEKKAEVLKKAAADERAGVAGATAARKAAQADLKNEWKSRAAHKQQIVNLNNQLAVAATTQQNISDLMKKTKKDLMAFSWKDVGGKVAGNMGGALKDGIKNIFSGLSLGAAVTTAYDNLTEVMATGGDNILASASKQFDAVKLGLSPKEYIEMNAASRQTILAAGGVNEQLRILTNKSGELSGYFKTIGDSTKYTQAQMDLLAKSGVKPGIHNAGLLNESFKKMQMYTGMTGDEFIKLQSSMAEDSDIQSQLRSASMAEREQILANNAARLAENVALGMTKDQALNVAKSMAKMANSGPLDRIKQAAKMRALGAAMGVDGADRAANIHLQGKRASAEDQKWLQEWRSNMSNKMSESQMGSLQGEITASVLQKQLGDETTGPDSTFNTRLAEGNKISEDALKQQVKVNENLNELIRVVQMGKVAKENPYVQATGGAATSMWDIAGSAAMGAVGGAAATNLGKLKKFLPGASAATAAVPTPTVPTPTVPTPPGAGTGARAGGKALLKSGIKKLPVIGALAGLGFAAGRAMDGDWTGAGMEAASGMASLAPGPGTAASIGIDAALAYRDMKAGDTPLAVPPTDSTSSIPNEIIASSLQEKLGDGATGAVRSPVATPSLTSSETRAESTSPIGLQLAKMEESNQYLKDLTQLSTKQLELAEKQLAATVVSQEDKAELFKSLASGNKFMTSYSTIA